MQFRVLGEISISEDGRPVKIGGPRQVTLLAALLANRNDIVPLSKLVDILWDGESEPERAERTTQTYVSKLRRVVGEERLVSVRPGYRLQVADEELDSEQFEQLVHQGQALADDGTPDAARRALTQALVRWTGEPYGHLADRPWALHAVNRLLEAHVAAASSLALLSLERGDPETALHVLRPVIDRHPERENLRSLDLRARNALHGPIAASRAFQRYRTELAEHTGLEPGPELSALEAGIIRGEVADVHHANPDLVLPRRNPYKGLKSFDLADAADFFGRDAFTDTIIERLRDSRLVTIVGPSGSGKSSVVKAGVLDVYRRSQNHDARVEVMTPGRQPWAALQRRMATVDDRTDCMLVVDQLEELYTLSTPDEFEPFATYLSEELARPSSRLRVLATIRADLFDRPLSDPLLGRVIATSAIALPALNRSELEQVILGPATAVGLGIDPAVVHELVDTGLREPGALPLVEFALTELTNRIDGARISEQDLEELGGVEGAVARRAETVYDTLSRAEQDATRTLFGRLIRFNESRPTRRTAPLNELDDGSSQVADAFVAARLLVLDFDEVAGGGTISLAHEALISRWPRLRRWVESDADFIRTVDRISQSRTAWHSGGRRDDELLRGSALAAASEVARAAPRLLNSEERTFIHASLGHQRREQLQAERQHRRTKRALVIIASLLVISLAAVGLAIRAQTTAIARGEEAIAARNSAETRRLTAEAVRLVDIDRTAALLLALEAYRRQPGVETLGGLQQVLVRLGPFLGTLGGDRSYVAVEWIAHDTIAAGHPNGIDFFDVSTAERISEIELSFNGTMATNLDGTRLAVATADRTVHVFDQDGELRRSIESGAIVQALSFAPNGHDLALGDRLGAVSVWDTNNGERRAGPFTAHPEVDPSDLPEELDIPEAAAHEPSTFPIGVRSLAFDPTGMIIASAGGFKVRMLDAGHLAVLDELIVDRPSITRAARTLGRPSGLVWTGPDEIQLAVGSYRQWWRPSSGELTREQLVSEHQAPLALDGFQLRGGGDLVSLGLPLGEIQLETADGEHVLNVDIQGGVRNNGYDVAISPNGEIIAVATEGIDLFATDGSRLLARSINMSEPFEALVSADGSFVTTLDLTTPLESALWDLTGTRPARRTERTERLLPDLYGPLTTEAGGELIGLTVDELAPTGFLAEAFNAWSGTVSPTEPLVAIGMGQPGPAVLRIVDRRTGSILTELDDFVPQDGAAETNVVSVAFSPDGRYLAAAADNGVSHVWETATWSRIGTLSGGAGQVIHVAYSPNGEWLLTFGQTGTVIVRDAESLQPTSTALVDAPQGVSGFHQIGFPQSGEQVVTSVDSRPRLFDLASGTLIGEAFPGDVGASVNVSADGAAATSIVGDDALIWNLDTATWVELACAAAGRNLSTTEWAAYGSPNDAAPTTCDQWPAPNPETTE